jgi:hypothetical protein
MLLATVKLRLNCVSGNVCVVQIGNDHRERQAYRLIFTKSELESMRRHPALIIQLALDPPLVEDGETFRWRVDPIEVTDDLKIVPRGPGVLCRDDVEASREISRLQKEIIDELNERPIAGKQTVFARVIGVQRAEVECILLSQLPKGNQNKFEVTVKDLPSDKAFVDIGQARWQSMDGSDQAALAIMRSHKNLVQAYRVICFDSPVKCRDGKQRRWAVERLLADQQQNPIRVLKRELFPNESEAIACFEKYRKAIPEERQRLTSKPVSNNPKEESENNQLQALRRFARTLDPKAKAGHERRIAEILAERAERNAESLAKQTKSDHEIEQLAAAQRILFKNLFPEFYQIKETRAGLSNEQRKEQMRRALAVDCKRLKITSPFNHGFTIDDDFLRRLNKAARARTPAKPHEIEVVLNWVAKKYNSLDAKMRAKAVSEAVGIPVAAANLKRTVARRYRLKAKLNGRIVK